MVYLSPEKAINKLFDDMGKYIYNVAGVTATSYAKEGTRAVAEAWADELIFFFQNDMIVPPLKPATVANREKRGISVEGNDTPLYETGKLLESIEFIHTHVPSQNYDILEVGVFDDTTVIGHSNNITPRDLALIHEYGNETTPARSVFEMTAMMMGHDITRRVSDVANKVRIAFDREKRTADPSTVVGAASRAAPTRKKGAWGSVEVAHGKIVNEGGNYRLKWDDE